MSTYVEGQTHQFLESLEKSGYTAADLTALGQNRTLLEQIKLVIVGLATIVRAVMKLACTKAFNAVAFLGQDWNICEDDGDKRANDLTSIDWEQILLETNLKKGEDYITGEEKLKRLKAGKNIRLGAKAFLSLWEDYQANKDNSVLEKLRKSKNITVMYFFGDVVRSPRGDRIVLCLCFHGGGWYGDCLWLGRIFHAAYPSVSLASV